jgi:multiple sugar transport system permease protein
MTTTPGLAAPASAPADVLEAPPPRRGLRRDGLAGVLMAGPAVLLLVLFVAVPFVAAIGFSFHNVRLGDPRDPVFM